MPKITQLKVKTCHTETDTARLFTLRDSPLAWHKYAFTLSEQAWVSLLDRILDPAIRYKIASIIYWDFWGSITAHTPSLIPTLHSYLWLYKPGTDPSPDTLFPCLQVYVAYPTDLAYIRAGYYNPHYIHRKTS